MATLSLKKKDLPFLLGGNGEVAVDTGNLKRNQPIADGTPSLLGIGFGRRFCAWLPVRNALLYGFADAAPGQTGSPEYGEPERSPRYQTSFA